MSSVLLTFTKALAENKVQYYKNIDKIGKELMQFI